MKKYSIALFTLLLMSSQPMLAAKGIKCRVLQESFGGFKKVSNQDHEFTISKDDKSQSSYLKTVVSKMDAELVDSGIKVALRNGVGRQQKILKFKKGAKRLSQTFIYASDNPNVTRNKVKVECLK